MNRLFTCLTILAMLLLADVLCIMQTIEFGGKLTTILLSAEGVAAGVFAASAGSLLRKRFARQKKPISRRPVAAAAQA